MGKGNLLRHFTGEAEGFGDRFFIFPDVPLIGDAVEPGVDFGGVKFFCVVGEVGDSPVHL